MVIPSRCFVPALRDAGAARAGLAAALLPSQRRGREHAGPAAVGVRVRAPGAGGSGGWCAGGVRRSSVAAIRAVSEPASALW